MKKTYLSLNGFSLVEALVAIGIMAAGSLALMKMNSTNSKAAKTISSNVEISSLIGEIRGILSDPAACTTSFLSKDAGNSGPLISIKNAAGNTRFDLVQKRGNIRIVAMNMSDSEPDVDVIASAIGDTYLNIVFNRGLGTLGQNITKKIRIWVDVNAAKEIITCRSLTSGTSNIVERSTTNTNDVFFDDGNFGIGTSNPTTKLYVNGDTTITGDTTINGDIQLGSSGTVCSGSNEGSQRYNSSSQKMQFCNGTTWGTLGGDLKDCQLGYRFFRNTSSGPWRSVNLSGTNTGGRSSWTVGNLNDECQGSGCGIQMRLVCP